MATCKLAWNRQGCAFTPADEATQWRVDRWTAQSKAQRIAGEDGTPLRIPIGAGGDVLRTRLAAVNGEPGRYALIQLTADGQEVAKAEVAHWEYVPSAVAAGGASTQSQDMGEVEFLRSQTAAAMEALRRTVETLAETHREAVAPRPTPLVYGTAPATADDDGPSEGATLLNSLIVELAPHVLPLIKPAVERWTAGTAAKAAMAVK